MTSPKDIQYMRAALGLARRGLGRVAPNPSVGCVLVKQGRVVAAERTADGGRPHAETIALQKAGMEAKGATAYVTLEPCSHTGKTGPCAEALIKAGVARVVVACIDPNPLVNGKGIEMLKAAGIEVVTGVLENEARALNQGFFLRVSENRPLVTLKVATTKDGKITPVSGQWITGDLARRHVHLERSMHDAILVGVGTVLKDNPYLTTRLEGVTHRITRMVMDSNLKIPLDSNLVKTTDTNPLWIFYVSDPGKKIPQLQAAGVKLFQVPALSPQAVVRILADEGITRLMIEGGGQVHTSFVKEGLGDRLLWYRAPQSARDGTPAFGGLEAGEILKSLKLKPVQSRVFGQDLLEIYEKQA